MKLYLIRHAQGIHNVYENYQIFDPVLTEYGIRQAQGLRTTCEDVDMVLTSTSTRTIQTARHIFPEKKLYATDLLCEYNTGVPCNSRPELDIQARTFPAVDFETYRVPALPRERHKEQGLERARRVLELLSGLKCQTVAIVSHMNFLIEVLELLGQPNVALGNCEYRVCQI